MRIRQWEPVSECWECERGTLDGTQRPRAPRRVSGRNEQGTGARIHLRTSGDEALAEWQASERRHEKGFSGVVKLAVILFFFFWASVLFLLPYQMWSFDAAYLFETIESHFTGLFAFLFNTAPSPGMTGRFCQCLAAVIAGAALASCGAVFQGSFRNVMAGPSTMGVMGGCTLGCLIYLLLFWDTGNSATGGSQLEGGLGAVAAAVGVLHGYTFQILVFAGGIAAVLVVLAVSMAAGRGRVSAPAMILSGTVLSSMVGNLTSLIQYYMIVSDPSDERIEAIRDLMLGNFDGVSALQPLVVFAVPVIVCIIVLMLVRNRLNLLSLGEDEATVMGLNVRFYRILMVFVGTVLTASVVAFCGQIGFLGFMIPLIGRKLAGPDMRYLLPACACLGALLLLAVYDVAYFVGMQDSLNVFTSVLGCMVMVGLLLGKRGGARSAAFEGRDMANVAQR